MSADTTVRPATDLDEPEVAFELMSRKLAGLIAAVEGMAARQQELHARDYGPDLAKIHERQGRVEGAILKLNERPAMALTPQLIASQIEIAGQNGRAADHQAWSNAHRDLNGTVQSVRGVVASALTAERQRLWIAGAGAAALVVGFAFGTIIPTRISQAAPESWHWPEAEAAKVLGRDGWDAGIRLLEVADAQRLRALVEAARMAKDNAKALSGCQGRAAKSGKDVDCMIRISARH